MTQHIRTRFAPSPTGYLHVGGLRTALFNYLFARHHGGSFVLRIEDTDQARYVEGATEQLQDNLKRFGLKYDEGPDAEGEYGPYLQSRRLDIYQRYIKRLLENGTAYYCFCSPEELEEMRQKQLSQGASSKYDGTWRNRSEAEVQEKLAQGMPFVVRLKMPQSGESVFDDLIRGTVRIQNELIDDQVLQKSDGFPTYHLANVIDDHLMRITHIIRGEEWLLSVPKHLQLYKAFGWEPPQMAHLPLLLNSDRSKLSKRQGDVAVEAYLEKGYLAPALINFSALLGWNSGNDEEFFTLEELIKIFSLERVNKSGSVFDLEKLNWMNGHYIRKLAKNDLVDFLIPFLEKGGADISDRQKTAQIIQAVYQRINKGNDIFEAAALFYKQHLKIADSQSLTFLQEETAQPVLEMLLQKMQAISVLNMDTFKQVMKEVQKETGIKGQPLWKPVRIALTGAIAGPELPAVIEVLGKEKACHFIQQVLNEYL